MKRTSFVCFGAQGSKDSLVYQEIPGRDGGEEFFLFISCGEAMEEPLLRNLFREAVSASRLGAPSHYFSQFIEQFKALGEGIQGSEDILSGTLLMIQIRRGNDVHLLCNRDALLVHWDAERGKTSPAESIRGFMEVPLGTARDQRDLFKRSPEDFFVLYQFTITEGEHTVVLVPSRSFVEEHNESLRNSIFFPSFEFPQETGIELAVARSFPALHWRGEERPAAVAPKDEGSIRRKRLPVSIVAGVMVGIAALVIFYGAHLKHRGNKDAGGTSAFLAASNMTKADSTRANDGRKTEAPRSETAHSGFSEAWKKQFAAPVTSSPRVCEGHVYFGCRDGFLYAFNAEGTLAWKYRSTAGIGASPVCVAGRVICANYRGDLFCLDAKTGAAIWILATRSKIVSTPAATEETIVAGTTDGRLIAVRLKDGRKLWERKLGLSFRANPTVGRDYVIAAATDGLILKLDGGGKILWKVNCGSTVLSSPVCLEDKDLVVLGAKDKCIHAYSLSGGKRVWKFSAGAEVSGALLRGPTCIFAGAKDGNSMAIGFDGKLIWRRMVGGAIYSRPLLVDDTLFVTTYSSKLLALDAESGAILGEYVAASPIYSSPEHDAQRIYFGSNGGVFYAIWLHPRPTT